MPIIKSAKKRAKQALVRRSRNLVTKQEVKTAKKALDNALVQAKKGDIEKAFKSFQSSLDKAVKKNLMHENKAARVLSSYNSKAKAALGVKKPAAAKDTETKKTAAKKPAAKKTATKKAPAKKTAAKKPTAKKSAAKKTAKKTTKKS